MLFSFQRPSASSALRQREGKKKPLRRRGPPSCRAEAAIGLGLSVVSSLRSFRALTGDQSSIAPIWALQGAADASRLQRTGRRQYSCAADGRAGLRRRSAIRWNRRRPTCRTASLQALGGEVEVRPRPAARRRGAPRPGPAAAAPRCGRVPKCSASSGGQVHRCRRAAAPADERDLLDLLGRQVLLVQPVEVALGRLGRLRRRGTAPRCAAPSARFASTAGRLGRAARRAAARSRSPIAESGHPHQLAEHLLGRIGHADVVAERLAHPPLAVEPGQDRHREHRLRLLAVGLLDVAAEQQVELLVGAAELDVRAARRPSRSPAVTG